ncbi:hypothetical protein J8J20_23470, partial [Mycobacterium tuberculosis]|nr:hypothetical protein [Mycobacterium tuberculosis]
GGARLWRDGRGAAIYEGTNAIQAIDLVTRKVVCDDGAEVARLVAEGRADVTRAGGRLGPSAAVLMAALAALDGATRHLVSPTADE